MGYNKEFEAPTNEIMILDAIKGFYYNQDLIGLLKYIKALIKEVGFNFKN